ncbi:cell wall-binding repeat-containing protein [Serinicoccus sp. LYQ131]|uniref:cell wall-binding repeat-containing protein n=1 Tax=Serinicoccus sp. LYQ131 TaxID=3378797 RepID=UPI003852978C
MSRSTALRIHATRALSAVLLLALGISHPQFLPAGGTPAQATTQVTEGINQTAPRTAASVDLIRISGADRYGTAGEIAKRWSPGVAVVYIANGTTFTDSSAAAAKAGSQDAPVLLTRPDGLPGPTMHALDYLKPQRIVIVGNRGKVGDAVRNQLSSYTTGGVQRLAGADGYGTAAAVAGTYAAGTDAVYLATGDAFADALTGAAAAGYNNSPILYTQRGSVPADTTQQLARLKPQELIVLGGTGAISDSAARTAATSAGLSGFRRIGGSDRYATAALIASEMPDRGAIWAATGATFADSTTGSALAATQGGPVVLVRRDGVPAATQQVMNARTPQLVTVFGGTAAISGSTASELAGASPPEMPGEVLFDADVASSGLSRYGFVHNAHRITVVNDPGPLGASRKVLKFEVHESDNQLTGNPRAQAETPKMFEEGTEVWAGFSTYFPSGWPDQLPSQVGNFVTFAEIYGPPYAGTAPLRLGMQHGESRLRIQRNKNYNWNVPWSDSPITKGVWHDWVIREKLSKNGDIGFVEAYRNTGEGWEIVPLNGKTRLYMKTIDSSNSGGPQYHKIALYYSAGMGLPGPLTMYFADHKVATSFAAAAPRSHGVPPLAPPE